MISNLRQAPEPSDFLLIRAIPCPTFHQKQFTPIAVPVGGIITIQSTGATGK